MKIITQYIKWILVPVALVVFLDELIKFIGLQRLPDEGSLVGNPFISLAIHRNWGIAFDFPFKLEFILLFSAIIGFWLGRVVIKNWKTNPNLAFSACIIILGALGNVFDRIAYGFTVDYIIIFGRSAINISDIVIVSGAVLLLLFSRRESRNRINNTLVDKDEKIT